MLSMRDQLLNAENKGIKKLAKESVKKFKKQQKRREDYEQLKVEKENVRLNRLKFLIEDGIKSDSTLREIITLTFLDTTQVTENMKLSTLKRTKGVTKKLFDQVVSTITKYVLAHCEYNDDWYFKTNAKWWIYTIKGYEVYVNDDSKDEEKELLTLSLKSIK